MQVTSEDDTNHAGRFVARGQRGQSDHLAIRSVQAVFDSHFMLRLENDVEGDIATNYSHDVVLISCTGALHGHEGVRVCARQLAESLPGAKFRYALRMIERDVAFLEWTAESGNGNVQDGVDTFLIREGKIVAQTIHYTVTS